MLTRLDLRGASGPLRDRLPRPKDDEAQPVAAVREIIAGVRSRGDEALRSYTREFDGVALDEIRVAESEIQAALDAVDPDVVAALRTAYADIESYHRHQVRPDHQWVNDGVTVRGQFRSVERAGCYAPGGRAAYPSTVLMTAAPAKAADVDAVVLCVPPGADGKIPAVTLAAAAVARVDEVYRVGGAQAIAAMAFGTESIPAVDVIVGPGNVYVAIAKREVSGFVGVPSAFAGPSEVVVVADGSAPASFAAIDVILQAEHGPDGLAWLVAWDADVIDEVSSEVARLTEESPRRDDIAATLTSSGYAVLVDGPAEAAEVVNGIAPEHLELIIADPESMLPMIRHAGAVFCGPNAPASLGDYAAGPNHVLPTSSTARFSSALSVDDFRKHMHVVSVDDRGFARLAPTVQTLATAEGLPAHARSVAIRIENQDDSSE